MRSTRFHEKWNAVQTALFHDCFEDAIGSAIQAIGGPKRVAGLLWPNDPQARSEARIRGCLNADRAERFAPGEVLRLIKLARDADDHSILKYLCAECGYQAPIPISPEQERAQLEREFNAGVMRLEALAKRLGK